MFFWLIDGVPASNALSTPPTVIPGETVTYEFEFRRGFSAYPADTRSAEVRHRDIVTRVESVGGALYDTYRSLDGSVLYYDQSPFDVDPFVDIDAAGDTRSLSSPPRPPRVWGLVESGENTVNSAGTDLSVSIDVFVLGPRDEYPDRETARSAYLSTE